MPLTRDEIIAASIELLDHGGEDGFTMRRLGDALGVHVPLIYAHINGKTAIIEEVLDRTIAELQHEPDDTVPWPDEIRRLMISLRAHLSLHPWLTRLSQQTVPPSLHAFGVSVQRVVARAGLDSTRALMYRRLIAWTVWGFAAVEAGTGGVERQERAAHDAAVDVDELFAAAVDGIVRGIEGAARSNSGRVSNDGGPARDEGRRLGVPAGMTTPPVDPTGGWPRERDGDERG